MSKKKHISYRSRTDLIAKILKENFIACDTFLSIQDFQALMKRKNFVQVDAKRYRDGFVEVSYDRDKILIRHHIPTNEGVLISPTLESLNRYIDYMKKI